MSEVKSSGEPDGGDSCSNDYIVDHMKLILSWNPGVCSTGGANCKSLKSDFVIQGLRPQLKDVSAPMRCCAKEKFKFDKLAPLTDELSTDWPALDEPKKDEEVWSEEWEKYGRCAGKVRGVNSIFNYFTFALKNFGKLKLKHTLANKSLYATNKRTYHGNDILRALTDHYGVRAELKCGNLRDSDTLALTEVNFCYDTSLKAIDCPYSEAQCTGEVMLLKTCQ